MLLCQWPGCVVRDRHVAECEDPDCTGCQPSVADRGRLCPRHWAWLNRDLSMCAELVLQVRESAVSMNAHAQEDRVRSGGQARPAPVDVSAVDACDELIALLVSASESIADQLGVPAPSPAHVWRAGHVVQGFVSVSPRVAAAVTAGVVSWWRDRLEEIASLDDVLDVGPELHEIVRAVKARWPAVERSRHLPGTPCRGCDLMDLWWTPPNGVGWPITVECHSCGYVAPEEDLVRLTKLVEFEQSQRRKAKGAKR